MSELTSGEREESSIRDHIDGECESDVVVSLESIPIIPEVVFSVVILECDNRMITTLDDMIPQDNLIHHIALSAVMGTHVEEDLFRVPVKHSGEITIQVEGKESQIIPFSTSRIVSHILHHFLHT